MFLVLKSLLLIYKSTVKGKRSAYKKYNRRSLRNRLQGSYRSFPRALINQHLRDNKTERSDGYDKDSAYRDLLYWVQTG